MNGTASCSVDSRRFGDLRGVQWRVDLGILPSSPSSSIDDLRRVTANSRRSYASLRKQLLVDPHLPKDGSNSPDLVMDNPLSQDPDSLWSRFFRNAELERMVDQDLTRLYPERGSYFQTSACQGMLRRILLLWCLRHPECGYRQGMHELLAPLLYVLHVDVNRLSEVRRAHEDHFPDKFDGLSYNDSTPSYKFDFKKPAEASGDYHPDPENNPPKPRSLADLDPSTRTIVLLSDAYGAEGELGTVLSEKFTEHDAYSMFDSLMRGPHHANSAVAMSDLFSPSYSGLSPIIEASSAVYRVLAAVDPSLHAHLIELGVEPQYFTLRWLRVLFGREFSLENLLLVWDETFACDNSISKKDDDVTESCFRVLDSPRGVFIVCFAVSMILKLRSSLLATENATVCLQRLLNFPNAVNLKKLISRAKSLQVLAKGILGPGLFDGKKPVIARGHTHTLSLDSASPRTPLKESYWEEKWRVANKEDERLCRSESEPCSSSMKLDSVKINQEPFSLLEDLAWQLQDDNRKNAGCNNNNNDDDNDHVKENVVCYGEVDGRDNVTPKKFGKFPSEVENFPDFSDPNSPRINRENSDVENVSGCSSVASNSSVDENYAKKRLADDECNMSSKCCSHKNDDDDSVKKSSATTGVKEERKGKLQWLWKLGRHMGQGEMSSRPSDVKSCKNGEISRVNNVAAFSSSESSSETSRGDAVEQNLMVSLRNLGQSMADNIQVIESILQEGHGPHGQFRLSENLPNEGFIVEKGQAMAMSALEQLRKISRILSEM
ncbi:Ypt/Rab-GAP domain of gyp1p superfamily protein [Striga hermonthica]|uniref:Ypt/Rab-GAP domain of gyp1p superfamily protein n=1 Tax=Striga hermonthica TaxID=68872 RepID=A0A9N7P3X7_STRHE|nr:Ypt/Rab-GAP domain of gyp1p superfamily protein [Striga hermonthica]